MRTTVEIDHEKLRRLEREMEDLREAVRLLCLGLHLDAEAVLAGGPGPRLDRQAKHQTTEASDGR